MPKIIRGSYNFPYAARGGVVTIGNFDGVHIGHQELIKKVIRQANNQQIPSVIITFEPHPFEFFCGRRGQALTIPRITRLREKIYHLSTLRPDYILILPFNEKLAETSADNFVQKILYQKIRPVEIIIGDDFKFGHARQGDFNLLKHLSSTLGYTLEAMPTVEIAGERVSSTRVRKALTEGNLSLATLLLNRPYSMLGRIRKGDQLGRQWGFPTANIDLHRKLTPLMGVFTVYVHGIEEKPLPGVANLGSRPTVDGKKTLLEVHLLNFNQDLYGRRVVVEFCEKLRDEECFASVELLIEQIRRDVVMAENFFKSHI